MQFDPVVALRAAVIWEGALGPLEEATLGVGLAAGVTLRAGGLASPRATRSSAPSEGRDPP